MALSKGNSMNRMFALNTFLALLITAALAMLTADIISYRLSHLLPRSVAAHAVSSAPALSEDLSTFAPILEKGLFGRATVGKLTPLLRESATSPQAGATSLSDLVLLGTVIGSFRETFALVQKTSSKEERVFRLGEKVYDAGPLLSVKSESIDIDINGKRTTLTTPTAAPAAAGTAAMSPGMPVAQVGAGSFVIDQKALNATLDNIGQAMTDARLLPSMKDNKVEGFRISEVKPAGVFGMIGIKNGDVLLRLNDFAIDSPEKAIQSMASLKGQTRLKLDLIRDGQPATFSYDIR
jgi:general secretion pathway protein C